MRNIFIYYDEGSSESSRGMLTAFLRRRFKQDKRIRRIYADDICRSDDWHHNTDLIIFPGGADLPYCRKLNGQGNSSIRRFVTNGGSYLGICAGAYYGAGRIIFNPFSKSAISGERELKFISGSAFGSLYELAEPYKPGNLASSSVVKIVREDNQESYHLVYWGGPKFIPGKDDGKIEILARYADLSEGENIAALLSPFGKGRALLCGVHPEYSGEAYSSYLGRFEDGDNIKYEKLADLLVEHDEKREDFFNYLIDLCYR